MGQIKNKYLYYIKYPWIDIIKLTHFRGLGRIQKIEMRTRKFASEIYWPLVSWSPDLTTNFEAPNPKFNRFF